MTRTKARSNVLDAITLPLDGVGFSDIVDMDRTKIINLLDPIDIQDAATKQYVDDQITNILVPYINSLVPAGVIMQWGDTVPPSDWVLCDGVSYNLGADASLADLWDTIGTTYGGTGPNDFKVPDLRGRLPLGQYTGAPTTNRVLSPTLGAVSGEGTLQLDSTHLPIHNHTGSALLNGNHGHGGTTGGAGGHSHTIRTERFRVDGGGSSNADVEAINYTGDSQLDWKSGLMSQEPDHNHAITGINSEPGHTHNLNIQNSGGTTIHENLAPGQTVNYIIKRV